MKRLFALLFVFSFTSLVYADFVGVSSVGVSTGGSAGATGTDWTADANMQALYLFEDTDFSSGTVDSDDSNDLGLGSFEAPAVNTTNYVEGSQSATFSAAGTDDSFYADDADLTSGFPGIGSNHSEITIAGWIRITTYGADNYWVSEINDTAAYYFRLYESDAAGQLTFALSTSSGSASVNANATCSLSTWYFVGFVYSDSNDLVYIYIRQQGSGDATNMASSAADLGVLYDIGTNGGQFCMGNSYNGQGAAPYGDGDAWAFIQGDALSEAELDSVFTYGWDGDGW